MSKSILLVDDEPYNLNVLKQVLAPEGYQLMFAKNGEKALDLAASKLPDMILLDVMMPKLNGYEICQRLKADRELAKIPVIFVTTMSESENEKKGFDVGAVDYITKPISPSTVLARVKTHLSLVRMQELEDQVESSIYMLGEAVHYNDTDTGVHIWRMASYAGALAEAAGWPKEKVELLKLAAPLHDTGKVGIPDSILKAPRKLTPEEWTEMKRHTTIGESILSKSNTPIFQLAAVISLSHHERWNGEGYPEATSGEAIPESARIVAIADVFDALTMKRPYKEAWSVEDAVAEIRKSSGSHFEPKLVDLFFDIEGKIYSLKEEWDAKEKEQELALF